MTPNIKIYIEGYLMEVDNTTKKIATSYQNFNFISPGSVKANFTSRISLPLTNTNKSRLEQIAPLSIITTKPYQNLSIRIVQDGHEIVPDGVCQITGVQDSIELDVQSAIANVWALLSGKYLNDIDTTDFNGFWSDTVRDSVRATTSGLVCPVSCWWSGYAAFTLGRVMYEQSEAIPPMIYYHTIITKIFELIGYTVSGDILTDARYLAMGITTKLQYNEKHLQRFKQNFGVSGLVATGVTGSFNLTPTYFYSEITPLPFYSWSGDTMTIVNADTASLFAQLRVFFKSYVVITGTATARARLFLNGVSVGGGATIAATGEMTAEITNVTKIKNGDTIQVVIDRWLGTGSFAIYDVDVIAYLNSDTSATGASAAIGTDLYLYYNELLERISLVTFIKDFMQMFCLLMNVRNNEVEFKTMAEVINETPTTAEISREDKSSKPQISYELRDWAQENIFKWDIKEAVTLEGQGKIEIANDTLAASKTKYTSIFTQSDNITRFGIGKQLYAPIHEGNSGAFVNLTDFGTRLFLMKAAAANSIVFYSAGPARTDYLIAYTIDYSQTHSIDWQEFIDVYYPEYAAILAKYCEVEQSYLITGAEAVNMDLTVPKIKDGQKYIIEKVSNHVPGQFAKVKLIKI